MNQSLLLGVALLLAGQVGCNGSNKSLGKAATHADAAIDSQEQVGDTAFADQLDSPADAGPADGAIDSQDAGPEPDPDPDAGSANQPDSPGISCGFPTEDGAPGIAQSDAGVPIASIVRSESTNADGVRTDIYCDGSAIRYKIPCRGCVLHSFPAGCPCSAGLETADYFAAGAPAVLKCLSDLQAVGDVSTIAKDRNRPCVKSVSAGTTSWISFHGEYTDDLSCPLLPLTEEQHAMIEDCTRFF